MTKSRTLHPTAAAARIAPLLLALATLAIAAGGLWLWRHRRQIAAALVTAAATTYAAGAWCRQQIEALATDSAGRLPAQPVAALAPITASLAAAWGLVNRAAMTRAKRAQQARMADIASAYGLELDDLLRPIKNRYSAAAAATELLQRRYTSGMAGGLLMLDQSPEWIREALKSYFLARPGIRVDSVDLIGYFHVASVLEAAEDLVRAGWLVKTDGPYPKLMRINA
jgi:hypothetical protein